MKMTKFAGSRLRGFGFAGRVSACSALALWAALSAVSAEPVRRGSGANTERAPLALPETGFLLTVDGRPEGADAAFSDEERRADLRLDRNDVTVSFDGLGAQPRLDAFVSAPRAMRKGEAVQFESRMNYPAFVSRGEIRLYSEGGQRLVQTAALDPNGQVNLTLPQAVPGLSYSYRVYDAKGRYDETALMPLSAEAGRPLSRQSTEDGGTDSTARREIPVRGGAVTVHVRNLMSGSRVSALGATASASRDGTAVISRILPVGEHEVEVSARGVTIIRPVEIPASDWFLTGVADLTLGRRSGGFEDLGQGREIRYGRLQGYANGFTASGWEITASADTQEDELGNLLRNITRRDPRAVLSRLDPDLYYPTYGDDSELRDDTPTSSGLYLKAEREGSHAMLGDFRSSVTSTELLRNERQLYGAQGVYRSPERTSRGEARFAAELYAAQPEELARRDQFRATGGSSYFLSQRDISVGSEVVQIEIRDPDTGRMIARQTLSHGRDYEINYAQGLVMLRRPLSGFVQDAGFVAGTGQDGQYLIVQYEYVPLFEEIDGYSTGGRAEAWLGDHLRIGVTGSSDSTGAEDQTAAGADLRLAFGETSYLQIEQAESEGPGFGSTFSSDGGMNLTERAATAGEGAATRLDARLDATEMGLGFEGALSLSYEAREAGFSTLDRQAERDETMGELALSARLSDRSALRLEYSRFEEDLADQKTEASVEFDYRLSDSTEISLGYYHLDRLDTDRPDRSGKRDDMGLRLRHKLSDQLAVYGYGIGSLAQSGGIARGDRLGLGAEWQISERWSASGEISDGAAGEAGRAQLNYQTASGSAWLGYELEADRDTDSNDRLSGADGGKLLVGARSKISDQLSLLTETSYDMFGDKRSLSSAYGVEYLQNSQLTHDFRYEYGRVHDKGAGDVERRAFSLGTRYDNKAGLAVKGRVELRQDEEAGASATAVENSVLLSGALRYDLDDSRRLIASADLLRSDGSAEDSRDYTDITLGYAMRPVEHDRWTMLVKYQYYYDLYGQMQGGTDLRGPRQRSHVFSVDGSYKVAERWTLGAKIGGRSSEREGTDGSWTGNDAYIAVLNARYHLPHRWDLLVEGRYLGTRQAELDQSGLLVAGYKHVGEHFMLGAGYNFSRFSDDLTDLVQDDQGFFINFVAKY